jgi:hypothetical protein
MPDSRLGFADLQEQRARLYEQPAATGISGRAAGKTRSRQLAGAELEKVRREVANYKEFLAVSEQIVEVSEAICEARSAAGPAASARCSRRPG